MLKHLVHKEVERKSKRSRLPSKNEQNNGLGTELIFTKILVSTKAGIIGMLMFA